MKKDPLRGSVSFDKESRQINVKVFGKDPEKLAGVKKDVGIYGRVELRIIANERDHADIIKRARALENCNVISFAILTGRSRLVG